MAGVSPSSSGMPSSSQPHPYAGLDTASRGPSARRNGPPTGGRPRACQTRPPSAAATRTRTRAGGARPPRGTARPCRLSGGGAIHSQTCRMLGRPSAASKADSPRLRPRPRSQSREPRQDMIEAGRAGPPCPRAGRPLRCRSGILGGAKCNRAARDAALARDGTPPVEQRHKVRVPHHPRVASHPPQPHPPPAAVYQLLHAVAGIQDGEYCPAEMQSSCCLVILPAHARRSGARSPSRGRKRTPPPSRTA